MSHRRLLVCCAVLPLATGCFHQLAPATATLELLDTDRAWARQASAGRSADSVVAFWAEDARVVMAGEVTRDGKPAIRQMVTRSFATPGFHISWVPERADVAASGDFGYTTGTNELSMRDAAGKAVTYPGRYIAVWRRAPDGRWRCIEDYSTPSPTAASGRE